MYIITNINIAFSLLKWSRENISQHKHGRLQVKFGSIRFEASLTGGNVPATVVPWLNVLKNIPGRPSHSQKPSDLNRSEYASNMYYLANVILLLIFRCVRNTVNQMEIPMNFYILNRWLTVFIIHLYFFLMNCIINILLMSGLISSPVLM